MLLLQIGALAYGVYEAAVSRIESLEHFAKLSYYLELANIQNEVDADTIQRLEELRPVYGLREKFDPCRKRSTNSVNEEQGVGRQKLAKSLL